MSFLGTGLMWRLPPSVCDPLRSEQRVVLTL